jgi:aminoacrylate hydrolase
MHYDIIGRTEPDAETIVLSAGLGGARAFWQPQIDALAARFRVVSYDHRGTGRSPGALPDGYSIGHMANDVIEIIQRVGITRCHFMGHALGGLVGLELALRQPGLLDRLILVNAWAAPNSHTTRCFAVRRHLLTNVGVEAYVQAQPIFLYPASWLVENAERVEHEEAHGIRHFQGVENISKRIDALLAFDVNGRLGNIAIPVLVAASRDDVLVPWKCSQALAAGLPNATLVTVSEGGHGFTVTEPKAFNATMLSFLTAASSGDA